MQVLHKGSRARFQACPQQIAGCVRAARHSESASHPPVVARVHAAVGQRVGRINNQCARQQAAKQAVRGSRAQIGMRCKEIARRQAQLRLRAHHRVAQDERAAVERDSAVAALNKGRLQQGAGDFHVVCPDLGRGGGNGTVIDHVVIRHEAGRLRLLRAQLRAKLCARQRFLHIAVLEDSQVGGFRHVERTEVREADYARQIGERHARAARQVQVRPLSNGQRLALQHQ